MFDNITSGIAQGIGIFVILKPLVWLTDDTLLICFGVCQ